MSKRIFLLFIGSLLCLQTFGTKWTYYYITFEDDDSGSGAKNTKIGTCDGKTLATVTSQYAKSARLEGTGKLSNGRVLNVGSCSCNGGYYCFEELNESKYPWGIGSKSNPLYPYVSVASLDFKVGTTFIVKELQGVKLPNTNG